MKKSSAKLNSTKVKTTVYKKAGGAMKSVKKPLKKYQGDKSGSTVKTPFQDYMKNTGAVPSDTVATVSVGDKNIPAKNILFNKPGSQTSQLNKPIAKSLTNQKALEKAFEKTYGIDYGSNQGRPAPDENVEQFRRRMGPLKKTGGSTKMKKGGVTKAAKFAALAPPYNKATAADRIAGAKKNARKKKK